MGSEWEEMGEERNRKLGRSLFAVSQLLSSVSSVSSEARLKVLLQFVLHQFALPSETLTET